jgi:hypothetical protein
VVEAAAAAAAVVVVVVEEVAVVVTRSEITPRAEISATTTTTRIITLGEVVDRSAAPADRIRAPHRSGGKVTVLAAVVGTTEDSRRTLQGTELRPQALAILAGRMKTGAL